MNLKEICGYIALGFLISAGLAFSYAFVLALFSSTKTVLISIDSYREAVLEAILFTIGWIVSAIWLILEIKDLYHAKKRGRARQGKAFI